MTAVLASTYLAVPMLSALLLLRATLPVSWALVVSLSVLVGFGLSSFAFVISLFLFDELQPFLYVLDFGVLAVALVVYLRSGPLPIPIPVGEKDSISLIPLACLAVAAVSAVAIFIVNSVLSPHGEWDAWAIWNLRARFLYGGGPSWRSAFDARLPWSHPDYPLLLPSLVARGWMQLGSSTTLVPAFVAFCFAASAAGGLYGSLSMLKGRRHALLGALCLLGTPAFAQTAATQLADVPLGCIILAACALVALHWRDAGRGSAFWAGFLCGMAAWTKNEGALFVLCIVVVGGLFVVRARPLAWRGVGPFVLGVMPSLILLAVFKTQLAPPSYLFEEAGGLTLARISTPGRYVEIARAFLSTGVAFGGWLGLALTGYLILVGPTRDDDGRRTSLALAGVLALMLAGFSAVYVITPKDLAWQLEFSLSRLLLQLWPSALLALFLFARGEMSSER